MPTTLSRATLIAGMALLLIVVAVTIPAAREPLLASLLATILVAGTMSVPQQALAQAREACALAEQTRRNIAHLI